VGIGQTPEKEYGQMVGVAQKTKMNYHKKQNDTKIKNYLAISK